VSSAGALAHPNIALAKYWGKQPAPGNYPAVPSLSLTLAGLSTRTRVTFDDALAADVLELVGRVASAKETARATALLDRVRAASGERRRARVVSANDFPTASGLASSASGFAALAVAAVRAAGLDWDAARTSDLARSASASAARSLFGGWVELASPPAHEGMLLSAAPVAPPEHLDVAMLVCVTTEAEKGVGSTEGMQQTSAASPYHAAWLELAPGLFSELRAAVLARDLERMGTLAERSAFAMHAAALAAGVSYLRDATWAGIARVRELRAAGRAAWATMDAGPHVKVLVSSADAEAVAASMREVPGVLRVLVARPGPGAALTQEAP
jgi:diphosphomevalonate decarboxylase